MTFLDNEILPELAQLVEWFLKRSGISAAFGFDFDGVMQAVQEVVAKDTAFIGQIGQQVLLMAENDMFFEVLSLCNTNDDDGSDQYNTLQLQMIDPFNSTHQKPMAAWDACCERCSVQVPDAELMVLQVSVVEAQQHGDLKTLMRSTSRL